MRTTSIRRSAVALALLALAGCGSTYGGGSAPEHLEHVVLLLPPPSNADLSTANSALGRIVVAAHGRTVYVFDKDTPGAGDQRLHRRLPGEVAAGHGDVRRA